MRSILTLFILIVLTLVAGAAFAQGDLSWWTVDGGGGASQGGGYSLNGTIGQPDAGRQTGGSYTLTGGFFGRSPSVYFADMMIRTPADTSYLGDGVYNVAQEREQSVVSGSAAIYYLKVRNDGNCTAIFTLTGTAGGSGWSVKYFPILVGGTENTAQMTGAGVTLTLDKSAIQEFRVEVTPDTTVAVGAPFTVEITATPNNDPLKADTVSAVTTRRNPLTAVGLTTNPASPQLINTAVTLTAAATGGLNVEYLFKIGFQPTSSTWNWTVLKNYSPATTCAWIPTEAHPYTLVALAREVGNTSAYQVMATKTFTVRLPFTGVSVTALPLSPKPMNTAVTLTAIPAGGVNVEYKFRVGYQPTSSTWNWTDLRGYSTTATCPWTPNEPRTYTLVALAREVGNTTAYQFSATLAYKATPTPITAVSLAAQPAAPQKVGTLITLTATPTGGWHVEYKFKVGYQDTAGWHWTDLRDYQAVNTCAWIPSEARKYSVVVYAREIGNTAAYQAYSTLVFTASP